MTGGLLCLLVTATVISSYGLQPPRLIVGVNKYSHDTSICIVDAIEKKILFSQAKERISGKKHDGGDISSILTYGLEYIKASIDDIHTVVSNNHHYRVSPFERRIPFSVAIKSVPPEYALESNLLRRARHLELSHHLAHAWSVVAAAPFEKGLVVVMDGMGESFSSMREDMTGIETHSGDYMHDLKLLKAFGTDSFRGVPSILNPSSAYREAESAYVFDKSTIRPVFKRWSRERSPSELFNHGFENMESLGAVYSRISSHILGDWNSCGKIMGLSSWSSRHFKDAEKWIYGDSASDLNLGKDFYHKYDLMSGNPYEENSFQINWDALESLPEPNLFNKDNFGRSAVISSSVQADLETSAIELLSSLKETSGESNLALVGGVALNSVMNGRIITESGFNEVYIPPAPGDEGIAVGCAMYGLHRYNEEVAFEANPTQTAITPIQKFHFSAYQGADFSDEIIKEALLEYSGWIEVKQWSSSDETIEAAATALSNDCILAWFQGRSEFGQRALGSRSILADPRKEKNRRLINELVKEREWWRPLAPSVLQEESQIWFDMPSANASPYMSLTCKVKEEYQSIVPAICHIDGSARLQTVSARDNTLYHELLSAFFKKTKVPMVLNTSFNRKSQPIIETPSQAIETFLSCEGKIDYLFIGNFQIRCKPFPLAEEFVEDQADIPIFANPIYLTEITSSVHQSSDTLRVRVQDGRQESTLKNEWKEFPSLLHLELLQSLQNTNSENTESGDYDTTTVADIHEVFTSQSLEEGGYAWADVVEAIEWLYSNNYVYFDDSLEDIDPTEAFAGMDIVDMR